MPHIHSRQAFHAVACTSVLPEMVRLYATLVTIELMLKDALAAASGGTWRGGHDLHALLVTFDAGLSTLGTNLRTALGALYCTDKFGAPASVSGTNYPHIRYLRHSSDSQAPASNAADVTSAFGLAMQCVQQLKQQGLTP